jgi:hypothetical protein
VNCACMNLRWARRKRYHLRIASFLVLLLLAVTTQGQEVTVVDLAVLYTRAASVAAGGPSAIREQIQEAVMEANTVFQNSRINARISPVFVAMTRIDETGQLATDLTRLKSVYGHSRWGGWRIAPGPYSADLVCLVTEGGEEPGYLGTSGPSSESRFSVIRRTALTGQYLFPVVLSYNFGCQGERRYDVAEAGLPYAHAHTFFVHGVQFSTVEGSSGYRAPFFSAYGIGFPDAGGAGVALGKPSWLPDSADNALLINTTAKQIAGYRWPLRHSIPPNIEVRPSTATLLPLTDPNLDLTAYAWDEDGRVRSVDFWDGTNRLHATKTTHDEFVARYLQMAPGTHNIRVVAFDNSGASTISEPLTIFVGITNDNFADAMRLTSNYWSVLVPIDGATIEPGEPGSIGGTVWYAWTASSTGRARVFLGLGAGVARLNAYTGDVLTNLTSVLMPDNTFQATAGTTYHISVSGRSVPFATLELFCKPDALSMNDNFGERIELPPNGGTSASDNTLATSEPGEPSDLPASVVGNPGDHTIWWTWTALTNGTVAIYPRCDFAYLLGVYSGSELSNLTPLSKSFAEPSMLRVTTGTTIQISLDGLRGFTESSAGPVLMNLAFTPTPSNDNFASAAVLAGSHVTIAGDTAAATPEVGGLPLGDHTVWYSWRAPKSMAMTLKASPHWPTPWFYVVTGDGIPNLTIVPGGAEGVYHFYATGGITYHVVVDSGFNWPGPFSLTLKPTGERDRGMPGGG